MYFIRIMTILLLLLPSTAMGNDFLLDDLKFIQFGTNIQNFKKQTGLSSNPCLHEEEHCEYIEIDEKWLKQRDINKFKSIDIFFSKGKLVKLSLLPLELSEKDMLANYGKPIKTIKNSRPGVVTKKWYKGASLIYADINSSNGLIINAVVKSKLQRK